jgi:hypothetical protein
MRALAAAPQPGPEERHITGLRSRYDPELSGASAPVLFLQLGALHDGHTAHLHGAPDHSGRIAPLIHRNPISRAPVLPHFRFSGYARHFLKLSLFSMRKIRKIASKKKRKSRTVHGDLVSGFILPPCAGERWGCSQSLSKLDFDFAG